MRAAHLPVGREHALDNLLGIAHPLRPELGHVHGEDGAAGAAGELVGPRGLAAAGAAGEQDREALPHARLLQPLLHAREIGGLQQRAEPLHLLGHLPVVEELAGLDRPGRDEIPVLDGLGLRERHFREEGLLDVVDQGQLLGVLEPLVAAEGDEPEPLEVRPSIADGAPQALLVFDVVGQGQQLVDREVLLAVGNVPVAQRVEEALLRVRNPVVGQGGLRLPAEFQLQVVFRELGEVVEQAFRVDVVPEVVRNQETDAGEDLLRAQAGVLHRLEVRVLFDGPNRLPAHHIAVSPAVPALDDAQVLHLPEGFAEAQELDVRAPDVVRQVIVVTAVPGVVLQDGGQQHGGALSDGKALAHAPDVLVQVVFVFFGEPFRVHLLVNAVQAGRQPRDRQGPGAPVLLVHLFSPAHPMLRCFQVSVSNGRRPCR